jgi:Fur family ferric uptake transcriptional regulator
MKSANDEVLQELSMRGYRVTEARKSVVEKLKSVTQPVTIQSLCAALSHIDEASVYRTVRMLLQEGLLEEIRVAGKLSTYALSHGHHHHAVCTACGAMEHIECHSPQTAVPASFKTITAHEVTLYGLCKKCA